MSLVRVVADDREAKSGTVDVLRSRGDVDVSIRRLPVGDYEVEERLLFERKTLLDLAVSLKDGRLLRQAYRLASAPLYSALILEGTARDLAASGMRREALQGALVHITLLLGLPLLRARNPQESAHLMLYAARQFRNLAKEPLPRRFPAKRPGGKHRAQLQLLQGLPGIGPERARRLLAAFGSIEAVFRAGAEELAQVEGIGNKTARAIRQVVREPARRYALRQRHPTPTCCGSTFSPLPGCI